MATASGRTVFSTTLVDPVPVVASGRTVVSVMLSDPPPVVASGRTVVSRTLVDTEPAAGPRVWSPIAQAWIPVRFRHHSPGTAWE